MNPKEKYDNIINTIEKMVHEYNYDRDQRYSDDEIVQKAFEAGNAGYMSEKVKAGLFAFMTNRTPKQYVTERRMMLVYERLINEDDFSYNEAYWLSGVDSQKGFIGKFKNIFGVTPDVAKKQKDKTKLLPFRSWDLVSDNIARGICESTMEPAKEMHYGIELDKLLNARLADNLKEYYELNQFEADIAYDIAMKNSLDFEHVFEYVYGYVWQFIDLKVNEEDLTKADPPIEICYYNETGLEEDFEEQPPLVTEEEQKTLSPEEYDRLFMERLNQSIDVSPKQRVYLPTPKLRDVRIKEDLDNPDILNLYFKCDMGFEEICDALYLKAIGQIKTSLAKIEETQIKDILKQYHQKLHLEEKCFCGGDDPFDDPNRPRPRYIDEREYEYYDSLDEDDPEKVEFERALHELSDDEIYDREEWGEKMAPIIEHYYDLDNESEYKKLCEKVEEEGLKRRENLKKAMPQFRLNLDISKEAKDNLLDNIIYEDALLKKQWPYVSRGLSEELAISQELTAGPLFSVPLYEYLKEEKKLTADNKKLIRHSQFTYQDLKKRFLERNHFTEENYQQRQEINKISSIESHQRGQELFSNVIERYDANAAKEYQLQTRFGITENKNTKDSIEEKKAKKKRIDLLIKSAKPGMQYLHKEWGLCTLIKSNKDEYRDDIFLLEKPDGSQIEIDAKICFENDIITCQESM